MAISAYLSTQETTNASRTHRLILGPCTDELRDVLHHFVPPQTFPHVIKQKLDRLPCLTGPRKDLILPRSGSCTGNSTNMDICLLYILLRNIRSISPHSKGWSNDPDPNDCSPSACIETIRLARNQCVYSSIFSLSNTEFSHIWSNVRTAVVNLDTFLNNGCKNVKGFDFLRYETMDPVCDQHYHEELRKQVEEDLKTREMVTNLKREHGKFEENAKKGGEVEKNVEKLNEVFQVKQEPEWDLEISVDNSPCQETETQTSRGEKKHQLETDLVLDLTKKQRVVLYTLFLCQDGWDATIIDDCVGDIDVTKIVKELENKGQVYSGIPSYHKLISCDKKSEIIKSYRENCPLSDIDKNFFIQVASDKYIEIDDDVYCCHLDGYTKSEDIDPITTMRPIMEGRKRKLFSSITGLCWILLEVILLGLLDCGCNEQIHWFDLIDPSLSSDHNQEGCLESRRQKKCVHCKHCCHSNSSTKDDNYDSHTDNRNHRCNCRICMNSLLRFTEVSLYKVVGFTKPHAAAIKISLKSSEHYDVLSHFCDVDISLICLGGIGGIVPPFPLLWMSKASTFIERYDEQVLNPLSQTSEVSILERYRLSILECHRLSILDCFEQNDIMYKEGVNINLYRLSLLHSCFLQIMKEVEHNSSRDPMPWPFIQLFNTFYLSSICSILIASILGKLMTKVYVKESKNGNAISPILKYCMRKEEVRHYVKQFFLEQEVPSSNCLNERGIKPGSKASNMNKHDDSNNGVDEHNVNDFHEIFTRIEIRPVEILAYPATQQPVLEPILNKFSVPERAPSKHDTMAVEFLRLCTMHDYPNTNGPSLLRLAQAGFFYEGNGNELVCFSCDFRKGSWNYNDSPREIHLRMSPNCKFLSQGGDGNVPVPRGESTQDLVPLQSAPPVVEPDSPQAGYIASTSNNTAHLASANYSDGQDQPDTTRRTMVVKHPEYASRPARLASYANFPRHMKQHPADMTDAGFYYAGFGDCCRCYHCGIGLRNWDPEDNPWIEHARWSMECPYILKIKGQAFIDLVQEAARAAEMAQDDEDSEAEGACNGNESDSGNGEKSGASNSSPSGGPAANEIENNVAKTSEATMSKGTSDDSGFGSGSAPVAQPIKAPLRTAAAQSLIHDEKIKPKYVTAAIEDLVKAEGWGAFTKENIRKYLKIHEENRKSASSASNADPTMLKQENKELKDLTICKICLDEKVSIVFLPCGHLVSCPQCAPALTKCPICRKNIKGTVRTNLVEKSTAK